MTVGSPVWPADVSRAVPDALGVVLQSTGLSAHTALSLLADHLPLP